MAIVDVLRYARELTLLAKRMGGVVPVPAADMPLKALAEGIAERGDALGLTWQLIPATVATPGDSGEMRVTLDGDSIAVAATSMIGRLAVGARVFVILSPPAGVHIVGFLGYDFPPSVAGEAIGRPRMIVLGTQFNDSTGTLQTVTGMSFTAAANAVYEIRFRGSPAAVAADDYKIDWTVPSGAGMNRYNLFPSAAYAGNDSLAVTSFAFPRQGNATSATGGGISAAGGSPGHWEDIYLKTTTSGGTVQLRFARSAASGSTASLRADSYMIVQRFR